MRSYTWGSAEGVQAVINSLPERYPMTLNADAMEALIRALAYVSHSDACAGENGADDDHEQHGPYRECLDGCWRSRAEGLLGSIAESLGADWV